jgi:hypothetical protein
LLRTRPLNSRDFSGLRKAQRPFDPIVEDTKTLNRRGFAGLRKARRPFKSFVEDTTTEQARVGGIDGDKEPHLPVEAWKAGRHFFVGVVFSLCGIPGSVAVYLGSPTWQARALSRPKVDEFAPRNHNVNFRIV